MEDIFTKTSIHPITDYLYKDVRSGGSFYLKTYSDGELYRNPEDESICYDKIGAYLQTPRHRLIRKSEEPILVIQEVDGKPIDIAVENDPNNARRALDRFVGDTNIMWKATVLPMDEKETVRNIRQESTQTLGVLSHHPKIEEVMGMKLVINGTEYPPLVQTLTDCYNKLTSTSDPVMTLTHGDEHWGNIIAGRDGNYKIIDPKHTGFNSPAQTYNLMMGSALIYYYDWAGRTTTDNGTLNINYIANDTTIRTDEVLSPSLKRLHQQVSSLSSRPFLTDQYLFINLMRASAGMLKRPGDTSKYVKNGLIYAGIATRMYYDSKVM